MPSLVNDVATSIKAVLDGITPGARYDYTIPNTFVGVPEIVDENTFSALTRNATLANVVAEFWYITLADMRISQDVATQTTKLFDMLVTGKLAFRAQDLIVDTARSRNAEQVFWAKVESVVEELGLVTNYQFGGQVDVRDDHGGPILLLTDGVVLWYQAEIRIPGIERCVSGT